MTVVVVIATTLIVAAAVLALVRLERGPSMLDRTVAFDLLTTTIVGAVAVEAALSRRTETIPILVVLSLVGFIGSVTIARFAAVEPESEKRIRTAEEVAAEDAAREAAALEAERRARRRGAVAPVTPATTTTARGGDASASPTVRREPRASEPAAPSGARATSDAVEEETP